MRGRDINIKKRSASYYKERKIESVNRDKDLHINNIAHEVLSFFNKKNMSFNLSEEYLDEDQLNELVNKLNDFGKKCIITKSNKSNQCTTFVTLVI